MPHNVIPVTVSISVPDVDDQIAAGFDQIQVHRSTTGLAGVFAEITVPDSGDGPGTRLILQAGVTEYEFEDPEGSDRYYYKFRLFDSLTPATGPFSTPVPGVPDPVLSILTVDELKTNYLFGLDLTNDQGEPFPDSMFIFYLKSAVSWLEHRLDLPILKTVVEEERHDYYRQDYDKYIYLQLDLYPVVSIEEVKLVLPGEQVVQVFEKDWIHIQRAMGQLQLVPGTGTAGSILLGASASWIPLIYGNAKFIPDAFRVKYTAGFAKPPPGSINPPQGSQPASISVFDPRLDKHADVIRDLIGKIAAFGPLNIAGDLLGGAGIASQSIGIDGLSQSFNTTSSATNAGYGARLVQYRQELKDWIPTLKSFYKRPGNIIAV